MAGKITQVGARSEDDIDPRNGCNLFGVFHTNRSLNHDDHHHVVIGYLAVVASPQSPVLSVAFWISLSVASATRIKGTAEAPLQAQIILATSSNVRGLCCISIHR